MKIWSDVLRGWGVKEPWSRILLDDMRVRVLYFGVLKELFGRESEMVELAEGSDVAGLLAVYRERRRAPAKLWESLAVAVNQEYARAENLLKEGDEVALLPPVSGGSDVRLSRGDCGATDEMRGFFPIGKLRVRMTAFFDIRSDDRLKSSCEELYEG